MFRSAFAAAAAMTLAACATAAADGSTTQSAVTGGRDCFPTQRVSGYTVVDEHHVRVRVSASRYYMLTTDWDTHGLEWDRHVALTSNGGFICAGAGLGEVRILGNGRSFRVTSVERVAAPAPG